MKHLKTFENHITKNIISHNGIIYFSELNNLDNIYYFIYILDTSQQYVDALGNNSVSVIKTICDGFCDDISNITGYEIPYSDTKLVELLNNPSIISYGFKIDGNINNDIILTIESSLKETHSILEIKKVKMENNNIIYL